MQQTAVATGCKTLLVEMTVARLKISLLIAVKTECSSDSSQNSQL